MMFSQDPVEHNDGGSIVWPNSDTSREQVI